MGGFNVDLGCDLIASQDFVTLTLFPLLKKSQLPFLLIFYFSPRIEPDRKDFGMRKRKLPPNHPNAKKKKKKEISPVKTSFYWGESHALGKGKTSQEKCPLELRSVVAKCCPMLRCSMGGWASRWSMEQIRLGIYSHHT